MTAKVASKAKKTEKKSPAAKPASKAAPKAKAAAKPAKATVKPVAKAEAKPEAKAVVKPAAAPKPVVAPKAAPKVEQKPAVAVKPVAAKPEAAKSNKPKKAKVAGKGAPVAHAVGRRKAAVARVWLRRNGTGKITVNDMPANEYFSTDTARRMIKVPSTVVAAAAARYDVDANVYGGGVHGQADAVKLAISRALVKADETVRPALKEEGLLRVDARVVERKKFGQKKARRRFQFVKR